MNHPYKVEGVGADLPPAVRASVCRTPDLGKTPDLGPRLRGNTVSKPHQQHTFFEGPVLPLGHSHQCLLHQPGAPLRPPCPRGRDTEGLAGSHVAGQWPSWERPGGPCPLPRPRRSGAQGALPGSWP